MRSKRAFYNIFSSLILQIVTIIYGFIIPKIIISFYGSNVNGLISSVTQLLAYISLLDSGFTAVIKAELYKPIVEHNDNNINNDDNKIEYLNIILKYKDNGINMPFTIEEGIIKESLGNQKYAK